MEDKVIFDQKYIENHKVALKSNVVFLAIGIALFVIYAIFSVFMINHMVTLASSLGEEVNIFQKIVYFFNSRVSIYAVLAEFMSVAMIALFVNANDSEVYGVFITARVFSVISVATLFIPLFVICLI